MNKTITSLVSSSILSVSKLYKSAAMSIAVVSATVGSMSAYAIPPVEQNSKGAAGGGGFWAYGTGWVQDAMAFGVPTLLGFAFLWMMWELWTKIAEQRKAQQAEWGSVYAFGGASAIYFLVATFLSISIINMYTQTGAAA